MWFSNLKQANKQFSSQNRKLPKKKKRARYFFHKLEYQKKLNKQINHNALFSLAEGEKNISRSPFTI